MRAARPVCWSGGAPAWSTLVVCCLMRPVIVRLCPGAICCGDSLSPTRWTQAGCPSGAVTQNPSSAGTSITVTEVSVNGQLSRSAAMTDASTAGWHGSIGVVGAGAALGAGALAGSSLPLDPVGTALDLGFASTFDNSLDAVSDRDFVAESLFALSLLGVHLSRIGEEVCLWASDEFGFLGLDDAFSTGSSMMPQKKNPDIAELARGRSGRLIGHLTGILTTLKGLPLTYNRDLQEDKEPLFDALDQTVLALAAIGGLLATASFKTDAMAMAADSPYAAATDLAELLVEGGTPFREAHAIVGDIVRRALAGEASMADLVREEERLGEAGAAILEPGVSVTRRTTRGGAGPVPVADQLERFRVRLSADAKRVQDLVT